jgi:AcrR family transcriptional regulator
MRRTDQAAERQRPEQTARSETTRRHILGAAFRVVAKHTIDGTRMPMIAAEAGVSQGILHYYFDTKDNLLLSLCNWVLYELRAFSGISTGRVVSCPDPENPSIVCKTFLEYLRLVAESERDMVRVFYDFWVQAAAGPGEVRESFKRQFALYREDVKLVFADTPLDPSRANVLASMVVSLFEGAALQLILDEDCFNLNEYLALTEKLMVGVLVDTVTTPA